MQHILTANSQIKINSFTGSKKRLSASFGQSEESKILPNKLGKKLLKGKTNFIYSLFKSLNSWRDKTFYFISFNFLLDEGYLVHEEMGGVVCRLKQKTYSQTNN